MKKAGYRAALVEALLEASSPMTLKEFTEVIGAAPATIHKHLSDLVEEGSVQRIQETPSNKPRFVIQPRASIEWTYRNPMGGRAFRAFWTLTGDADWRFPLVGRIPDDTIRNVVLRFLRRAEERGLFVPWLNAREYNLLSEKSTISVTGLAIGGRDNKDWKWSEDPEHYGGVAVFAVGDCLLAGRRLPEKITLVVLQEEDPPSEVDAHTWSSGRSFVDLSEELNVGSEIPLDLKEAEPNDIEQIIEKLLENHETNKVVTVHSTLRKPWYPEIGDLGGGSRRSK